MARPQTALTQHQPPAPTLGPLTGTVIRPNREKGFLFITADQNGRDYFCHVSALEEGLQMDQLQPGQKVKFEGTLAEKGLRAEHVGPVD